MFMTKNQIDSLAPSVQRNGMIAIERSDLSQELREYLFAARNCSANRERCNQLAPLANLFRGLHNRTNSAHLP